MLLFKYCILLSVLVTLSLCLINKEKENDKKIPFLWGTATAAYQIEGSVNVDGRSASIWDTFSQIPGKIFNNDTGAVADDSYVQFRKDIQLMKSMGVNSHRFSFSWSRILPDESGKINQKAIRHYNEFINELLRNDIQPMVTLYHWDLPDYLEKKYNGWLSHDIVKDFAYYSEVCFNAFGDRVKMWITINEPWTFCYLGYVAGAFAPGRCSDRSKCDAGDSATEGYIAAHNVLNAHAASVNVYRTKFQPHQHGEIGITLNHDWNEPQTSSPINIAAAERKNLFSMGWFGDPIVFGKYPKVMRDIVGTRLPEFTTEESDLLKGSFDFWALNHYSTKYVSQGGNIIHPLWDRGWSVDINFTESRYSVTHALIGPQADSPWLNMVPWGFYRTLRWSHDRYAYAGGRNARTGEPIKPFKIYVTENGCDVPGESELPRKEALEDTFR